MKSVRPFVFLALVIALVGLACGTSTPTQAPAPQQQAPTDPPVQQQPTNPPPPPTEPPTPIPTEPPTPQAEDFFTEEFDFDTGNWDSFFAGPGDSDLATFTYENGRMVVDLGDEDIYMYYMYLPYDYGDVRVTMSAENRGRNNNNVSLVCRFSDDGWYEFSVESGGLWYLYAAVYNNEDKLVYNVISNGGARSLKQGMETNEYALECNGNKLTMWVNGVQLSSYSDNKYVLRDGMVGFNISSLNVLPIIVEVDWFSIEEP